GLGQCGRLGDRAGRGDRLTAEPRAQHCQRRGPAHRAGLDSAAAGRACAAPTNPSPAWLSPLPRVSTVIVTDSPGRNSPAIAASAGTAIRTGTRCTILVKLPVALTGGSRLNWAPLAGAKLSTRPVSGRSGYASTKISAAWPTRIRVSCVSLKLAVM